MGYHVYDGDRWYYFEDRAEADQAADEAIAAAQDDCDPEWPTYVDEICIAEGPPLVEHWERDELPVVAFAAPTNKRPPDVDEGESDSVDYYCDYEMRAPSPQKEGGE